jgi:sn-glycerol 3-phosphate transport system substrate-binding protein
MLARKTPHGDSAMKSFAYVVTLGAALGLAASAQAQTEIHYKVVATYKGGYDEAMAAAIAAFRAGNAPNILQVFEVGTATMMHAKGAVVPVAELMKKAGESFDPSAYVPAVAGYYTSARGEMQSLPFNASTTVFYYNKDKFAKAGLDPEKPPVTWQDVVSAAAKLKASGERCAYTTGWQSWVHLESFSAWHNVEFASKGNGLGGLDTRLKFNSPCMCATSRTWRTGSSRATSAMAAARANRMPSSIPANAR